jgi:putative transposase
MGGPFKPSFGLSGDFPPILESAWRRDLLLKILEEGRRKYRFVIHGYVVMPEHVHLLITEPEEGDPSVVMSDQATIRASAKEKIPEARFCAATILGKCSRCNLAKTVLRF